MMACHNPGNSYHIATREAPQPGTGGDLEIWL